MGAGVELDPTGGLAAADHQPNRAGADHEPNRAAVTLGTPTDTLDVPTDPQGLRAFLATGSFEAWPHQAAPHPSAAPHDPNAQVYMNPTLAPSVERRTPTHPPGSAAILVLSDEAGRPLGWAVAVKTEVSSRRGQGWYWYAVRAPADAGLTPTAEWIIPDLPDAAGNGLQSCVSCHLEGHDLILTESLD